MIDLLTSQEECDAGFQKWVDALLSRGQFQGSGWSLDPAGLYFTNYGQSARGTIGDQVMLGHDTNTGDGTVKIVRPTAAKGDRGALTTIGRDARGGMLLLREGRLKPNNVSRDIRGDFAALSGLAPIPVRADGKPSKRQWYVVADLSKGGKAIVDQTNDFTLACVRARSLAGGGRKGVEREPTPYSLGLDEKYRVIIVNRKGGRRQVKALQGAVFEALRKRFGDTLIKPRNNGYEVDGLFSAASLLVEIKTGTFAKHCCEGTGQLKLYPTLVGLDRQLRLALLIPDRPPLRPVMARALHEAGVEVYTYGVGELGKKPKITFSPAFLSACEPIAG